MGLDSARFAMRKWVWYMSRLLCVVPVGDSTETSFFRIVGELSFWNSD